MMFEMVAGASTGSGLLRGQQDLHPHELECGGCQLETLPAIDVSHVPSSSHPRHRLGPPEELLDQLSAALALLECRAALLTPHEPLGPRGVVAWLDAPGFDRHVRLDPASFQFKQERLRVVSLVGPKRRGTHTVPTLLMIEHLECA